MRISVSASAQSRQTGRLSILSSSAGYANNGIIVAEGVLDLGVRGWFGLVMRVFFALGLPRGALLLCC